MGRPFQRGASLEIERGDLYRPYRPVIPQTLVPQARQFGHSPLLSPGRGVFCSFCSRTANAVRGKAFHIELWGVALSHKRPTPFASWPNKARRASLRPTASAAPSAAQCAGNKTLWVWKCFLSFHFSLQVVNCVFVQNRDLEKFACCVFLPPCI